MRNYIHHLKRYARRGNIHSKPIQKCSSEVDELIAPEALVLLKRNSKAKNAVDKVKLKDLKPVTLKTLGLPRGGALNIIYETAFQKQLQLIDTDEIQEIVEERVPYIGVIASQPVLNDYGQFVLFKTKRISDSPTQLSLGRGGQNDFFGPEAVFIFKGEQV